MRKSAGLSRSLPCFRGSAWIARVRSASVLFLSCCSLQINGPTRPAINFHFILIYQYVNYNDWGMGPFTSLLSFLRDSKFQQTGRGGEYTIITSDKNHESQPWAKEETDILDTASDLSNEVSYILWKRKCCKSVLHSLENILLTTSLWVVQDYMPIQWHLQV